MSPSATASDSSTSRSAASSNLSTVSFTSLIARVTSVLTIRVVGSGFSSSSFFEIDDYPTPIAVRVSHRTPGCWTGRNVKIVKAVGAFDRCRAESLTTARVGIVTHRQRHLAGHYPAVRCSGFRRLWPELTHRPHGTSVPARPGDRATSALESQCKSGVSPTA